MNTKQRRQAVYDAVTEAVDNLLVYSRTADKKLPPGGIEAAVWGHDVTISELTQWFTELLRVKIPVMKLEQGILKESGEPRWDGPWDGVRSAVQQVPDVSRDEAQPGV